MKNEGGVILRGCEFLPQRRLLVLAGFENPVIPS
jgi:hypothetical protein